MTVCNVSVRDHSIFLASDTLIATPGKPPFHAGKIHVLSHMAGCVIGRGHLLAAASFAGRLNITGETFDEITRKGHEALDDAFRNIKPLLGAIDGRDPAEQSILLAGYSDQARRMGAVMFRQEVAEEGFRAWEINDDEPSLEPSWIPQGCDHSVEGMIEATREQYRAQDAQAEVTEFLRIGGKLIVAEITPGRVVVEPVWDLDADRPIRTAPARSFGFAGLANTVQVLGPRIRPSTAASQRPIVPRSA